LGGNPDELRIERKLLVAFLLAEKQSESPKGTKLQEAGHDFVGMRMLTGVAAKYLGLISPLAFCPFCWRTDVLFASILSAPAVRFSM